MKKVLAWQAIGDGTPLETDIRRAYAWELISVIPTVGRGKEIDFSTALTIIDNVEVILDVLKEYHDITK